MNNDDRNAKNETFDETFQRICKNGLSEEDAKFLSENNIRKQLQDSVWKQLQATLEIDKNAQD